MGRIGGEVAKRLEAFDCRIKYHSRNKKPFVSYTFYSNVVELASNSDVLVLCCPLSEQTMHIINKEVMSALGKDGIIVNVGRGALIDEKELVQCLIKGDVKGAGLDVFENEPHVPKELMPLDDVPAFCCPLAEQTRHIINREMMLALRQDGVIVNAALIDGKELAQCV